MKIYIAVIHWGGTNVGEEELASFPDIVSAQNWVDKRLPDEDEEVEETRWDIVPVDL